MKAVAGEIVTVNGALSARESQQLQAAEADVEKGGKLIVAAMELIRDQRLYRATHETFADYCRERWGRTARDVNRLIQTEAVVQAVAAQMGPNGSQISNRAAREVADLPPETAAAVVAKAAENGKKPTAKAVADAREEVAPKAKAVSEFFDAKKPATSQSKQTKREPFADRAWEKPFGELVRWADSRAKACGGPVHHAKAEHLMESLAGEIKAWQKGFPS